MILASDFDNTIYVEDKNQLQDLRRLWNQGR